MTFLRFLHIPAIVLMPLVVAAQGTIQARAILNVESTSGIDKRIGSDSMQNRGSCPARNGTAITAKDDTYSCIYRRLKLATSQSADAFFGGLQVGNGVAIRLGESQTTLYSDLVSDNLYVAPGIGFARVGFATLITAAQSSADAQKTQTVDQFFQGGGNAMLYVAAPLFVWMNFATTKDTAGPFRQLNTYLTSTITADIPKLGTSTTKTASSYRLGLQGDFTWRTARQRIGLFATLRTSYVKGNAAFNENLVGPSGSVSSNGLLAADYSAGVDLAQLVRIGASAGSALGTKVRSPWSLTVTLLRQSQ